MDQTLAMQFSRAKRAFIILRDLEATKKNPRPPPRGRGAGTFC